MKPLFPVPHLSASSLGDWLRCPLLWYGRRVAKWPAPPSPDMALGKALHEAFAAHHEGKDPEMALFKAWAEVAEANAPQDALERAIKALKLYREHNPPDRRDRPEKRFSFRVPDVPVPMIGFIDLIRGDDIHEFKTGRGRWGQQRADAELQATVYWWAYQHLIGLTPRAVVYHIIVTSPSVLPPYCVETVRTPQQIAELIDLTRRVWGQMCRGEMAATCPPNWCQFPDYCLAWSGDATSLGAIQPVRYPTLEAPRAK